MYLNTNQQKILLPRTNGMLVKNTFYTYIWRSLVYRARDQVICVVEKQIASSVKNALNAVREYRSSQGFISLRINGARVSSASFYW